MNDQCAEYLNKIVLLERQIKLLRESRKQEGRLRTQLTQTMDSLKKKERQLQELNEHLEQRVEERTHELNISLRQLSLQASTDHLTKIINRMKFNILLEQKIKEDKRTKVPMSIVFFDIDYFKQVNDTYGHTIGDEVLVTFSKIISENIREEDIFSRWGGEEFIAIFDNCDTQNVLLRAERLREIIANTLFSMNQHITCSIGVTEFIETDDSDTIILRVDRALYQAKENGRNRVVCL